MARQDTLEKVDAEIAEGKLGIARDRLRGLLSTYPGDPDLRNKLGQVNWKLGYPIEAGRFWFSREDLDEVQEIAVQKFLAYCNYDHATVLKRSGVPVDEDAHGDAFTREVAERMVREYMEAAGKEPQQYIAEKSSIFDRLFGIGCLLFVLLAILNLIYQIVTLIF